MFDDDMPAVTDNGSITTNFLRKRTLEMLHARLENIASTISMLKAESDIKNRDRIKRLLEKQALIAGTLARSETVR